MFPTIYKYVFGCYVDWVYGIVNFILCFRWFTCLCLKVMLFGFMELSTSYCVPTVYKYVSEWLCCLSLWGGQLHIVFPKVYNYVFEGLCCLNLCNCRRYIVFRQLTNMCLDIMLFGFMELYTS